jgi:4-amino-4-deoxy-L-arabinose transferase-like glycosyltransferase
MYQVWLFLLIQIKGNVSAVVDTGTGFLCAVMPYGWYRTFKELLPKRWALGGALVMALVPGFISAYAYFMNETLLLSLTGFAFWATFRALRKRTVGAFALVCALWLAAGFTRTVALPMGLLCLLCVWLPQPQRLIKAAVGLTMLLIVAVPAGLHARINLHYFAPLGNPYLAEVYQVSGNKNITINLGPNGGYQFGSPSFYNPTFYPFSDWLTDRDGVAAITIDLRQGRASWIAEKKRVEQQRSFPQWRGYWENFLYLTLAQSWPDNDRGSVTGWLTVWTRWMWPPLILAVAVGAARGRFQGREWLLPICGLGMFLYLTVQQEGVMEGRYRKPIDPVLVAAAVVMVYRLSRRTPASRPVPAYVVETAEPGSHEYPA